MIKKCDGPRCESDFQDQMYGKGSRVMNPLSNTNEGRHRCTVCGRETTLGIKKGKK